MGERRDEGALPGVAHNEIAVGEKKRQRRYCATWTRGERKPISDGSRPGPVVTTTSASSPARSFTIASSVPHRRFITVPIPT